MLMYNIKVIKGEEVEKMQDEWWLGIKTSPHFEWQNVNKQSSLQHWRVPILREQSVFWNVCKSDWYKLMIIYKLLHNMSIVSVWIYIYHNIEMFNPCLEYNCRRIHCDFFFLSKAKFICLFLAFFFALSSCRSSSLTALLIPICCR